MSLNSEFFIKRQSVIDEYEHQGYVYLDTFMTTYSIDLKQIQDAGFIENKPILSTIDFYELQITAMGRNYIHAVKNVEIYLVKPNCSDILAQKILSTIE